MAGFEVVVRPAVFPDIRPAPAQPVPPADDPDQGFATIQGNGAKQVSQSFSYSSSTSTSQRSETQRRVDEARIYQKDDDGKINKKNFVDIEAVNKVWMKGPPANYRGFTGDDVSPTYAGRGYTGDDIQTDSYRRIKEADNIEIRKKDKIKKRGQG